MNYTRRQTLMGALFGTGMLGLRALATGLPMAFLAKPLTALADGSCSLDMSKAQYLILSTSGYGDPINGNAPGSYLLDGIAHPPDASMAKTSVNLGGKAWDAAKPWATMDPSILARTTFFHHTTLTNSHANQSKVMKLMGGTKRQEMMVSLFAAALAQCLGTVQAEPVVIGAASSNELLSYQGRTLPNLSPSGLKTMLTTPSGPLANLQAIRDRDLNRLNALIKQSGNTQQRNFLDELATTQTEARALSQTLLEGLSGISGNDADNQAIAAAVLIKMNVAPVISMHIPFGGDNHNDSDLANESAQTVTGVASIAALQAKLATMGLQDKVTFAQMNVFGRTLSPKGTLASPQGRDHLANHHVSVIVGKNIKSSVIGGIEAKGNDFSAMGMDSKTGAPTDSGDIAFEDTLGAVAKTLGAALGLPSSVLDDGITVGKPVAAALAVTP